LPIAQSENHLILVEKHHGSSHDGGVAIYKDGAIVSLAAERVDRIKHSVDPGPALAFLSSRLAVDPKSAVSGPAINHPLAHAASAYYVSGFDEALILVIDGQGDYGEQSVISISLWLGQGTRIEALEAYNEPAPFCTNSIGHFYSAITYYIGFGFYDQGKTMALAPYGQRGPMADIVAGFCRYANGRMEIDPGFVKTIFDETYGACFPRWRKPDHQEQSRLQIEKLLGPIRRKDEPLAQRHRDLAYAGQLALEETILRFCQDRFRKHGVRNLCLAGGVALNVAANTRIVREAGFKKVFIQPAAGDDGQALGKLLYRMHNEFSLPRKPMLHAYLGPDYDQEEVSQAALDAGDSFKITEHKEQSGLLAETVTRIMSGQIIAWFQGSSEIGPRALGHRSILADPRPPGMRDRLNRVKKREDFQPFALAILAEHASEWFDLLCPSPFMLLTAAGKAGAQALMPAGLHVDGTSRLQTLTREENGLFYELVRQWMNHTGVPAILNTSFNDKGMPIVETPRDAIKMFDQMSGVDALVMGPFIVERK